MTLSQEQMKLVHEALKSAAVKYDIADEVMNTLASHGHGNEHGHGGEQGHDHGNGHGAGHGNGDNHGGGHGGGGNGHGGGNGDGHGGGNGGGVGGPNLTYDTIKGYASTFRDAMMELGTGITSPAWEETTMLVYMDRAKLSNVLAITPSNGFVAGILSVYNNPTAAGQQVTVSLLGTDVNLQFVKDSSGNPLGGEQCWKEFNTLQNFDSVFQ